MEEPGPALGGVADRLVPAGVGERDTRVEDRTGVITASTDLYSRIARLDDGQMDDEPAASPARALRGRLERDLIWNRSR